MPVLRSQTVYLSITVTLASCRLLCHSNTRSNIRSCSLMCLALSQHHAALALSCALLCLSITLLLLSHAPCFVSALRCSCSLMCLALFQHHATLALSCALFVSASRRSCALPCLSMPHGALQCSALPSWLLDHVDRSAVPVKQSCT